MKKTTVISLGGSLIIPEKINFPFLNRFKKELSKHYKTHKFVIVCGGGVIARKYISALRKQGKPHEQQALAGIRATRMNAKFIMQFFGKAANDELPTNMKQVKGNLPKNNIVVCGALRRDEKGTSDSTAAKLANYLKTDFINMTKVSGLYTSDPLKSKNAKFIPHETWKNFETRALKIKHKAGQHFVLDQNAATIIRKHKIKTYIIGPSMSDLSNAIKNKKVKGTIIAG